MNTTRSQGILERMAHQPSARTVRDVMGAVLGIDPNSKSAGYYVDPVTWPVLAPWTRARLIADWIMAEAVDLFDEQRHAPVCHAGASANLGG